MKKAWMKIGFVAAMAFAAVAMAPVAEALSIVVDLGTGAPPATLGGFTMTPFADDARPLGSLETTVPSPLGGDVVFSSTVTHHKIGSGWATWSHSYTGDVYATVEGESSLTMTLPASTGAFYFYAEPNPFDVFSITATSADGTTLTVPVDGFAGARGFGFYDAAGLVSIEVTSTVDFAVGEFGIAATGAPIPEPSTVLLLGLGLAALGVKRLRRS